MTITAILEAIAKFQAAQRQTLLEEVKRRWCLRCGLEVHPQSTCRCGTQDQAGGRKKLNEVDGWIE
jgi:hypothetical protein